jgi:hypothetical protein
LSQEGKPIANFSEKLNDAKKNYYVHDYDFCATIMALKKWRHYLLPMEFFLFTNHQDLQYLNTKGNLNQRHLKWVEE